MQKIDFHAKIKERPEWDFVQLFINNWLLICKDRTLNITQFCKANKVNKQVIYSLKCGNHSRLVYLSYYGYLSSLHNLTILDVLNYKAKE